MMNMDIAMSTSEQQASAVATAFASISAAGHLCHPECPGCQMRLSALHTYHIGMMCCAGPIKVEELGSVQAISLPLPLLMQARASVEHSTPGVRTDYEEQLP